jgi:hypothetical protein
MEVVGARLLQSGFDVSKQDDETMANWEVILRGLDL